MRTAAKAGFKPAILFLFVMALGVRIFDLNIPFLEPFNNYSRQSMCASVARNFYERGFNLLYPEIDENGSGPSLYNVEMPLYSYAMAFGYKLAGGAKEWAARLVSVLASMGFLLFLYLFVRETEEESAALWALGFAALSPMVVALSRSIQPDITMLFAGSGALYFFFMHRKTGKTGFLAISAVLMTLAVLTRVFALYLFLPIIYLAWEKDGAAIFAKPRYYVYTAVVSSALIWYVYMWRMGQDPEICYQPYRYSSATAGMGLLDFLKPKNLLLPAKAFFLHLLTPIGTVLFFLGLFEKGPGRRFFMVWLWSTVLYLVLMWRTAVIHPYYLLPLAPACAFFAAQGARRIIGDPAFRRFRRPLLTVAAVLLATNLFYYYRLLWFVPADRMAVVEAGKMVDEITPPGALVAAAYGASPIQLYYCHRRGWAFDMKGTEDTALAPELERLKGKGASFFMTTELPMLSTKPEFARHLSRYPVEKKTDRYVIYRLKESVS